MQWKFGHVGISVRNLPRSIAFYRALLDLDVVTERTFEGTHYSRLLRLDDVKGRLAVLSGPGLQIELFEFHHPHPRAADPERPVCDHGITHICLLVKDVEGAYRRMVAQGTQFHSAPVDFDGRAKVVYGRDPDGNVFELLELLETRPHHADSWPE